ncbi:hypothetical protein FKW77_008140 [Venturia effusa]|uniref:Zn(2)-C6 fungal-type domain-containing protein n=1 Tax=Venturia effusa TaxID=50376 RepID=A0A517LHN6_9PEZI|nr:hypothetical protein FKW77_008140 [Venturia effusa]
MDAPVTGQNRGAQPQLQPQHIDDDSHQHQQGQARVWTNPNPPLPRGRAPKDPDAVVTKFDCANLQELEAKLKHYLENPPAPAEHCSAELTLWAGASFLVNIPLGDRQPSHTAMRSADAGLLQPVVDALHATTTGPPVPPVLYGAAAGPGRVAQETLSVLDALQPMPDPKDTMKRQRAISKVCIASISKVDGFRYSFHNNWKSGEDNAYRFSYYCNDSLLNKDRVANGKAGSSGRRATKPVYDCKGILSIKFSALRQCVDVVYRHIRCHETYEERAPPPRRDAKRRAEWEMSNPDRVKNPRYIQRPASMEKTPAPPKKKKAKKALPEPQTTAESDLRVESMKSLLELMRHEDPPPPAECISAMNGAGPSGPPLATTNKQRAPARRLPVKACAICQSRKFSRCDGQTPSCQSCAEKGWPCFYLSDGPNGEPQIVVHEAPPTPVHPELLQQGAMAPSLTPANEGLQHELDQARNKLADVEKRAFELQSNLTEANKQLEQLRTENARLKAVAQKSISLNNTNHERRATHQQQTSQPQQPVKIPPPPQPPVFHPSHTQYPPPPSQMYHGQPAPSQAAHRAPVYSPNNRQTHPWNGAYGYQQAVSQSQQQTQPQQQQPQAPPGIWQAQNQMTTGLR